VINKNLNSKAWIPVSVQHKELVGYAGERPNLKKLNLKDFI